MSRINNIAKVRTLRCEHTLSPAIDSVSFSVLSILPNLLSKSPGESKMSNTTVHFCTRTWISTLAMQAVVATTSWFDQWFCVAGSTQPVCRGLSASTREADSPSPKITNSSLVNTPAWHTNPWINTKKMKLYTSVLYIVRETVCSDWLLTSLLTGTTKWIWGGSNS